MSTVTDRPDTGRPLRRPSSRRGRVLLSLSLCIPLANVAAEAPGAVFDLDRDGRIVSEELRQSGLDVETALSWQYLATGIGGQRDRKSVELSLTLLLDRSGHFSIQVLYANGDASAKLEDEEHWSLGLGVKF